MTISSVIVRIFKKCYDFEKKEKEISDEHHESKKED